MKLYLKMSSAALELAFSLLDLTEIRWEVSEQVTEEVAAVDSSCLNSLLIFRISMAIRRKEELGEIQHQPLSSPTQHLKQPNWLPRSSANSRNTVPRVQLE